MSGIFGDVAALAGLIVAAVLAILGYGRAQKKKGRDDAEDDAIQEDLETAKRIHAVRPGRDAAAARDRLRERLNKRDL